MNKEKELYKQMTNDQKKQFWDKTLGDIEHEYVRGFMIAEGWAFKLRTAPTAIMHLETGQWKSYKVPYDVALEMLKNGEKDDGGLIRSIYED